MGLREDKKAKTRKAISDIATALFLARGYDTVTTAEIAALAEVSTATLFNYFPTKEALLFDEDEAMEAGLVDAILVRAPGVTILEALKAFVLAGPFFRFSHDPGYAAFTRLVKTTPELSAYLRQMCLRYEVAVAEAITSQWENRFTRHQATAIARYVLEAVNLAQNSSDPPETFVSLLDLLKFGTDI